MMTVSVKQRSGMLSDCLSSLTLLLSMVLTASETGRVLRARGAGLSDAASVRLGLVGGPIHLQRRDETSWWSWRRSGDVQWTAAS